LQIMLQIDPVKRRIIDGAEELFLKYGIKTVTMDDIARFLSMSKKTIYHYFKDKNEIVNTVSTTHLEKERLKIESVQNSSKNAIEELLQLSKCIRENINGVNPTVFHDLKKYYNESWDIYMHYRSHVFYYSILSTLKNGIKNGYFREEIDPEILAILRMEEIQMLFNSEAFPRNKYDFKVVQQQFADHFIHGILTTKGKKIYSRYLTKMKNNETSN